MKTFCFAFCYIHLVVTSLASESGDSVNLKAEKLLAVESLVRRVQNELEIPGMAVGLVMDGETVLSSSYGLRNHKDGLSHVSERTLFAIGSCTKAFTTYVLDSLINVDRALNWSDLVISHIPEFRLSDLETTKRIRVKDLITHISGLPAHDIVWARSNFSRKELLARIPYLQTNYDLGEKYQYNNLMYVVAGAVVEKKANQSWEEVVNERIFKPENMTRSLCSIRDVRENQIDEVATPHSMPDLVKDGESDPAIVNIPWVDLRNIGPAAGIISSVEDMTKWIRLQLRLSGKSKEMHISHVPLSSSNDKIIDENFGYGLGWMTLFYRGRYMLAHSGQIDGFSSRVLLFPERKQGIVILANLGSLLHVFRNLTFRIVDILAQSSLSTIEADIEEWVSNMMKLRTESRTHVKSDVEPQLMVRHQPEQYVGYFENPGYGMVEVFLRESLLFASYNRDDVHFLLEPKKDVDLFSARSEFPREGLYECSFVRDSPSGDVIAARFNFEPLVPPIHFEKKTILKSSCHFLEPLKAVHWCERESYPIMH